MSTINTPETSLLDDVAGFTGGSRRKFLTVAAAAGLMASGLAGCRKIRDYIPRKGEGGSGPAVDLGTGDIGILNYAYLLEQLEASFYMMVDKNDYAGMTGKDRHLITDIMNHEIAHREFFKNALGKDAIMELDFDFSSVNFKDRSSVLETAKTFEDLGVSAYNGAGALISDTGYLLIAGKIVSVEARHAAYIRDLINYGSFADTSVVDKNGLDVVRKPTEVLPLAQKYIKNKINASRLPS